jgi:hypothetical protein
MVRNLEPVEINDTPDLLRLVQEVKARKVSYLLRHDGEDIAVLIPAPKILRRRGKSAKSEADMAAFYASAGGWEDMDTDRLKQEIYESRRISTRPPVAL